MPTGADRIARGRNLTGEELHSALAETEAKPIGGTGILVQRSGQQSIIREREQRPRRMVQWIGNIVSSVLVNPNQWHYIVQERIKATAGYGGWTDRPSGRIGTGYNFDEDANDGAGVEGHGVDVGNLPGDFATKPVPNGWPVLVTEVRLADGSEIEYWFERMNGIDGTCPP